MKFENNFFLNRSEVPWSELDKALADFNYEVSPAKKDGFCFLSALQECLLRDHAMNISLDDIKKLLISEIYQNNYTYEEAYDGGSIYNMLMGLNAYVFNGNWAQNIVDIAVFGAANALGLNICIFKNVNNRALLYFIKSANPSTRDIYMKLDHEHYDSIVWKGCQNDWVDPVTRGYFESNGVFFTHHLEAEEKTNIKQQPKSQSNKKKAGANDKEKWTAHPKTNRPTCEDIGSDLEADLDTFDSYKSQSLNSTETENEPFTSTPLNAQYPGKDRESINPENFEDHINLEPVPDKFLFTENYSGNEDGVLDNSSQSDKEYLEQSSNRKRQGHTSNVSSPITVSDDSLSSSLFSDSSTTSTTQKPRKYQKTRIDHHRMSECEVENVDSLPWEIDGDHVYELPATRSNFIDKYRDGRWFVMKDSTRKGLNGIRKTGRCRGSLICLRDDCPKLTTEGVINTIDFKRIGNNIFTCSSCGYPGDRIYCGAFKVVEFDRDRGTMRCEHQGSHKCHLKPNVQARRKFLDELPLPISSTTKVKKHMQDCFRICLENKEVDRAFELCDAVSEADVLDKIKKMRKYPNKSLNRQDLLDSFSHISHIQCSLKKSAHDRFLIYEWDCDKMKEKGSYVFNTSKVSLEMALKMGGKIKIGEQDSTLNEEPAFFDGMHRRVKNFVTLTMWVFHPGMRKMQILAVMECPREDTENIELFFRIFNKALCDYLDDDTYVWDPCLLMMDEKGANFEAVSRVFGENFRKTKTVTCQWHFRNCGERYITHLPMDVRLTFRRYCKELCRAHTIEHYRNASKSLVAMAEKHNFIGWWKFWSPRCSHIVPSLRGFNLPKMNLAEVGQSTMRGSRRVWLTEAVFADVAALAFQSSKYRKFVENREKVSGKGPTLRQKNAEEREMERTFITQIDDVLFNGSLEREGERIIEEPFTPSKRAKHKAPRHNRNARQGQEDDAEDDVIIVDQPVKPTRKNPQRAKRGQNRRYDKIPVQLNPRTDDREEKQMMVPDEVEKQFLKAKKNRVYYVVLKKGNQVGRCQGCKMPITEDDKDFPKNLMFVYQMRRWVPPPEKKGKWVLSKDKRNCYFHSEDLGCLRRIAELEQLQLDDLYMSNQNFSRLLDENIEQLERRDHWVPILENRRSVRLTGDLI